MELTLFFIEHLLLLLSLSELVADLREAILQIARHFDAVDPRKVHEASQNSICSHCIQIRDERKEGKGRDGFELNRPICMCY